MCEPGYGWQEALCTIVRDGIGDTNDGHYWQYLYAENDGNDVRNGQSNENGTDDDDDGCRYIVLIRHVIGDI